MEQFILPFILLVLATFVWLQNRKPIKDRAIAFDDPWGPLIYISASLFGIYLLLKIGITETIITWFASLFTASLVISIFERLKSNK